MDIIFPQGLDAYATENLSLGDDAAHGCTTSNLKDDNDRPVKAIVVTVHDNVAHFTVDGTAPTAAAGTNVGLELTADSSIVIYGINNITNFSIINQTAGSDAEVRIQYFS